MKLNKILFYLFFIFIFTPVVNAAAIYKWVDEDGQVHYGSKAESQSAKKIEIKNRYIDSGNSSPPSSAKERAEKQKRFLDALDAENKTISDAKKKKKEEEELKLTRCHASRDQLKQFEGAGALYDLDEKGNRILLNKKQYTKAMAQARARVTKWCN